MVRSFAEDISEQTTIVSYVWFPLGNHSIPMLTLNKVIIIIIISPWP